MATPSTEVTKKEVPAWTNARLDIEFDGANFEAVDANHHNEGRVAIACNRDDWFNDDFNVSTYIAMDKFFFQVSFNSEVATGLYNDGVALFAYDLNTGKWEMSAIVDGVQWLFCSAGSVVDTVLAGVECMVGDNEYPISEEEFSTVQAIADSIRADSDAITAGAGYYTQRADCDRPDPTVLESFKKELHRSFERSVEACTESHGMACDPI